MVREVRLLLLLRGPRGLTYCLLPTRGTFNISKLLNGVLPLTIYVTEAHRHFTFMLGVGRWINHTGTLHVLVA